MYVCVYIYIYIMCACCGVIKHSGYFCSPLIVKLLHWIMNTPVIYHTLYIVNFNICVIKILT